MITIFPSLKPCSLLSYIIKETTIVHATEKVTVTISVKFIINYNVVCPNTGEKDTTAKKT